MYRSKVEFDSEMDEYFIILPQELMEEMGIEVGDELTWVVEEDKIYLRKNSS
jgi:bifunctional DNA-binding transcriptional regulator/antitoxin component of YhaV-PrlF toxin-antitoxin module